MRRYRPSRSWPVGALALIAAAGAVLATGALSSAMDGGPDPAFAARIVRKVASARPGMEAHAANPAAAAAASATSAPPPAGVWRIQAGAFRTRPAAEAQLLALKSEVPEVARLTAIIQPGGGLNRVRIGGIGNEAAARRLCARLLAAGRGCFVAGPAS
ncbi:MAG: SPOR domain-containing protein [Allosphingosinicella sp.]